jgi:capsid protein
MRYWCNARWIGPARGYIDPEKEIKAAIAAIGFGLESRSQNIAERGGDFDEVAEQLAYERDRHAELGLSFTASAPARSDGPEPSADEADEKEPGDAGDDS